jgi:hypothetical protein
MLLLQLPEQPILAVVVAVAAGVLVVGHNAAVVMAVQV